MRIDYDDQALDIMNAVNEELHYKNVGYQFALKDEESDEDFLDYYLVATDEVVSY